MNDKEWMKKVYKKAEGKAEDCSDFTSLAESLHETLKDKVWVKRVYKKAVDKAANRYECETLAENLRDILGDKKLAGIVDQKGRDFPEEEEEYED